MKLTIAGLAIALGMTLLPPPSVTVQNPRILYALAMYKTAVGDTGSALRLMHRAEASQAATRSAQTRSAATSIISVAVLCSSL